MKEKLVDQLLQELIGENPIYQSLQVPTTYEAKRQFLRGLINLREPNPIKSSILELEDQLLELEREEKTIIDANQFQERIVLWQGDITTLKCDAIINAGNEYLLGCFIPNHSCIDNQIHTFAGMRLRLKCAEVMQGKVVKVGEVLLTKGYHLPCQFIIHTVGPQIDDAVTEKKQQALRACYWNSLELGRKYHLKTIAFPCISTGLYGYPKEEAALLAYQTVQTYLKEYPDVFDHIIFNVFTKEDYDIYEQLLKN